MYTTCEYCGVSYDKWLSKCHNCGAAMPVKPIRKWVAGGVATTCATAAFLPTSVFSTASIVEYPPINAVYIGK